MLKPRSNALMTIIKYIEKLMIILIIDQFANWRLI